jgi:tRNA threonylcarbamoyladenosine biosynthesis protein TsaE
MEVTTHSPEETKKLAYRVASVLKPGKVLALYGELGAGKTTFVRYLVEALGLKSRVQSPTFVIVREYGDPTEGIEGRVRKVNHVDLYRIQVREDVAGLGLGEIFNEEGAVTVVEWPELIEDMLPENTARLRFEYVSEGVRKINVQGLR